MLAKLRDFVLFCFLVVYFSNYRLTEQIANFRIWNGDLIVTMILTVITGKHLISSIISVCVNHDFHTELFL